MVNYDGYPSVNDYLALYHIEKVREIIGHNLRNLKFSEPNPEIILNRNSDESPQQIFIRSSQKDISLYLNFKNYSCVIAQSLAILNNSTPFNGVDFFNSIEKMSEQQFSYAIDSIKRKFSKDNKLLETLNSIMPKLEENLKKNYITPPCVNEEITLLSSNGSGFLINLINKTIVKFNQVLSQEDGKLDDSVILRQFVSLKEFEEVTEIIKKELDCESLNKYLNVEAKLRSKVKYNELIEKNIIVNIFDLLVVSRIQKLLKK